jgi:aspartate/glutamate racemase
VHEVHILFANMAEVDTAKVKDISDLLARAKGTIGIVGNDPVRVARLNTCIVQVGSEMGFHMDQHFPDTLAVGLHCPDGDTGVILGADVADDFGCDLLAVADVAHGGVVDALQSRTNLPVICVNHDALNELAYLAVHKALHCDNSRRPSLLWQDNQELLDSNIAADVQLRSDRMRRRVEQTGPIPIRNVLFTGIIGGSGPMASASFAEKLSSTTSFIHYSLNCAPSRPYFEAGHGPSYLNHYRLAVNFLSDIGAFSLAIPCNTAHKRLDEYCGNHQSKVVDIRKSVLDLSLTSDELILLGSNRTTGVDLSEGEVGIYEQLRQKYSDRRPFCVPSTELQNRTMEVIVDVKAGRLDVAKEKILSIVEAMREQYGNHPVIFGCTELPLVFTAEELAERSFIDPAESLAAAVKQQLEMERIRRVTLEK